MKLLLFTTLLAIVQARPGLVLNGPSNSVSLSPPHGLPGNTFAILHPTGLDSAVHHTERENRGSEERALRDQDRPLPSERPVNERDHPRAATDPPIRSTNPPHPEPTHSQTENGRRH
ncbi:hypothetical protein NDU88_005602 [Pleurodeles waltl]|uniref:Secreted protein n=1 Tax=Pleurodeles waltl TaxID=8319 RepID=A0AAV7NN04_PLEWA|nr:hypothetical protein NDU88_005602 [Pleurodeles waltl]